MLSQLSKHHIEINNNVNWKRKHWKSIKLNYSKAKYFNTFKDEIKEFYYKEWKYLVDLNYEMLLFFLSKLIFKVLSGL